MVYLNQKTTLNFPSHPFKDVFNKKLDLIVLIDNSWSIGKTNFYYQESCDVLFNFDFSMILIFESFFFQLILRKNSSGIWQKNWTWKPSGYQCGVTLEDQSLNSPSMKNTSAQLLDGWSIEAASRCSVARLTWSTALVGNELARHGCRYSFSFVV